MNDLIGSRKFIGIVIFAVLVVVQYAIFRHEAGQIFAQLSSVAKRLISNESSSVPSKSSATTDIYTAGDQVCSAWKDEIKPIQECLSEFVQNKSLWDGIHIGVTNCSTKFFERLGIQKLNNKDETKGFVNIPAPTRNKSACTIVTLGVGNDILAELKVKKLNPRCKFFGADPMEKYGTIYKTIGVYDPVAVSTQTGVFRASILADEKTQRYEWRNMTTITFIDYLLRNKIDFVDSLFLDNEGPEYKLLPYLQHDGPIAQADIPICQLSTELHCMPDKYGLKLTEFDKWLSEFLADSDYLPLMAVKGCHNRIYFINYRDRRCVRKYFSQFC